MSASSVTELTVEEMQNIHDIDRKIYSRLVINFGRDIIECMYVLSLWLWLEGIGYPNIVLKMLTLPDRVLNLLADEAVLCLRSLQQETPIYGSSSTLITKIPVTQELMEDSQITLSFLHQHRPSALRKIAQTVSDVWPKAFEDITQQALSNRSSSISSSTGGSVVLQQELVGEPSAGFRPTAAFQLPPLVGSGIGISPPPGPAAAVIGSGGALTSNLNPMAEPWYPKSFNNEVVPPRDRTMFITFSRGYPITETELREFFVRSYGSDCIEALYMQQVSRHQQSLYAHVLFQSAETIAAVLDGKQIAKYSINGKHFWARLHVEKQKRSAAPPLAAPPKDSS